MANPVVDNPSFVAHPLGNNAYCVVMAKHSPVQIPGFLKEGLPHQKVNNMPIIYHFFLSNSPTIKTVIFSLTKSIHLAQLYSFLGISLVRFVYALSDNIQVFVVLFYFETGPHYII